MKVRFLSLGVFFLGAALFSSPALRADTFDFSQCSQITTTGLSACPGDTGKNSLAYASGSLSVTVTGHGLLNSNLYVKDGGSPENGIGLTNDPNDDHEIGIFDYVQLDLSNLFANGITSGTVTIESAQTGEQFKICQGSTLGAFGTLNCQTGSQSGGTAIGTANISWGSTNDIISIQATTNSYDYSADILVDKLVTPSRVPEPGSLALFGSGLLGIAGMVRRRFAR